MAYEKYTIEDFMSAWFNKNYSVISETEFPIVYSEYCDTSGLFLSEDFEKKSYIYHLNSRINYVKIFIKTQREFIEDFDVPFVRDFDRFKKNYGYILKWNNDKDDFENQLKKIELKEKKHESLLEDKKKELSDLKNKKNEDEESAEDVLKKSRISFIKMNNSLGKIGYKIDKKSTTVEELSLMIKQQLEDQEKFN